MIRNPTLLAAKFPFSRGRHVYVRHEKKIGGYNLYGQKMTARFKLFKMKLA
jgi:hypothetical protein